MGRLQGKVAIITGAGRGIGRTMARRFAEEGAKIAVTSFTPATVDAHVAALNARHGRGTAIGMRCEVGEEADIKAAVARTAEERTSATKGRRVQSRVELWGRRHLKKKNQ